MKMPTRMTSSDNHSQHFPSVSKCRKTSQIIENSERLIIYFWFRTIFGIFWTFESVVFLKTYECVYQTKTFFIGVWGVESVVEFCFFQRGEDFLTVFVSCVLSFLKCVMCGCVKKLLDEQKMVKRKRMDKHVFFSLLCVNNNE